MSYWNRMISSILAGKRKTIVILCIAIVLSFLLLATIAIRSASIRAVKKMRSSIETSVSISTKDSYGLEVKDYNQIAMPEVQKMKCLANVKSSNYHVRAVAYAKDFRPVVAAEQKEAMEEKKREADQSGGKKKFVEPFNVSIEADSATKYSETFTTGNDKLLFGRRITEKDQHVCLINYKLANDNNLAIGSSITVKGSTGKEVKVQIIGLYATPCFDNSQIYDPYMNRENLVYTDLNSAMEVNDNTNVSAAEFMMKDPEENKEFVQQVIALDPDKKDDYIFSFDDTSYKLLSNSLQMLITITNLVFIGVIILGSIILTLLVAISMRDRDYEIGILLSMGERKYKIILQMIGEVMLPILIGAGVGVVITLALNGGINHMVAKAVDLKVNVDILSVLKMLGGTILLNLVGAILTIYKVIRYQPKDILMHIE